MKKFTIFACLAPVFVFALGSFAEELPIRSMGNQMIYGGSVEFNKAGADTINLMAATNDPTNNSDPRDGGLEPYYDGDFEDANGDASWNGWTHYDITGPTETHWNVSNYNQPNPTNYAAWCGDINFPSCRFEDPDGGYGEFWNDLIEFRQTVPNTDLMSTVTVTATLIYDSDEGWDFTYLSYQFEGQPIADIESWTGAGTADVTGSVIYLPQDYNDGTDIAVYFRFKSDESWSDQDCLWPTAGACQVDDINVHIVNGDFDMNFFEDFEHGGVPDDFGIWSVGYPDGVGDFAQIWSGLADADPCFTNSTPQVAFIDDGIIVPGTGGSDCINWCYGPAGYIVNTTGGLADETKHIHNAIDSPFMAWPSPKDGGGPDYDGIILTFGVYRHEDLSSDSPGIFFTWGIRSADTDDSAGNGVQDIMIQSWGNHNHIYWGGPGYTRGGGDVTGLMNPGRDEVQVQLVVWEVGWIWGYVGNDGYPAPYFDNVTVKVFPYHGPGMSTSRPRLAQVGWPERQSIDYGDLGSHSVRFDTAGAGDLLYIDISPVRAGAEMDGDPELHYIMDANPVFTPAVRTAGLSDQGSVAGMPVLDNFGLPIPGSWAFDLPDTGFLFPGDVLHYFISATDVLGGVGGSDPQTSLMPPDTTGFSTGFGDPMGFNSSFTFRALPSIRDDGEGGLEHPGILFLNDFGGYGGVNEWYTALNNIGLLVGEDYDHFAGGIGGQANHLLLADYGDILYTSGTAAALTISNGDIGGDDVGTLTNWLDLGDKDIFLTGDGLASDLAQSGSATLTFLEDYMGVSAVATNVRPLIGNQTTPLVLVIPGNPVFAGSLQTWIAFGGCLNINTFDAVNAFGTGQRLAGFHDPAGGQYPYSAATLNIMATGSRAISMPLDLMFVYTDPAAAGNDLPGRAQLLRDVLAYFGIAGDPQNVSPVFPDQQLPEPLQSEHDDQVLDARRWSSEAQHLQCARTAGQDHDRWQPARGRGPDHRLGRHRQPGRRRLVRYLFLRGPDRR